MYPAPFEYARARSWSEAVQFLQTYGDEAKVLAGGQSLVPMMALRLLKPGYVVDVNDADQSRITETDGRIEISALTRHAELERSSLLARACPLIPEAAAWIGNVRVRHRGTVGGSLAHADPAAELPCVLVALGAEIRTLGPSGERTLACDDLFVSYFTTALDPAEVLVSVSVPKPADRSGSAFLELARRVGDFATLEVAAVVELEASRDVCAGARLVFGAMGDRPVDLSAHAGALVGERFDDALLASVATEVAGAANPREDHRAGSGYRREMVRVLTGRALRQAADRAMGSSSG
jgi:CO/xanthine dehydrogenase FAD-binding subunit